MADRVSASITLGGSLGAAAFAELYTLIADERLSMEWGGETFEPHQRIAGRSLDLFAHDVPCGRFDELEAQCLDHRLAYFDAAGFMPPPHPV